MDTFRGECRINVWITQIAKNTFYDYCHRKNLILGVHFSHLAYVTIDAENHCYEYALLLGDNSRAYIFLQFIKEEEIAFPVEYLPEGYGEEKEG